ncbi:MAG: outer membrane protein assembly factor BamD [Gammaproteobacteria bacterium]|nr:outer membrane protein assembly factor BamD [Gammaproteobacteria bacterium]
MMSRFYKNLTLVATILLLSACSVLNGSNKTADSTIDSTTSMQALYQEAQKDLGNSNYIAAVEQLESFQVRFPFADLAKDAQLDLAYAYYRNGDREESITTVNRFIRENPRHEKIDYAYYLRGLTYFKPETQGTKKWLGIDQAKRPPHNDQMSYTYFERLIEKFPDSVYSADAAVKLNLLRNRLARYELNIASYYFQRQAYVAAGRRLEYLIETYPGAPSTIEANAMLIEVYQQLDLPALAQTSDDIVQSNRDELPASDKPVLRNRWW